MSPMAECAPRVALVTGGGRGIGRGIVDALAADGFAVALTYRRDEDAAQDAVETILAVGGQARCYAADMGQPATMQALVDAVLTDFGRLDVLVSNAGSASSGASVHSTSLEELDRILAVHAVSPHQLCASAVPHLRKSTCGRILLVSSTSTTDPRPGGAPYMMGKAALEALARTLAREERDHGVRVHVIAPGLVETEMGDRLVRATQGVGSVRELYPELPFGRACTPADIGALVQFLVGPGADYLNDQRIVIDGGSF